MNLCIFISTWLSRCILKTAPLGMKAKFRELERLHLKIIKERSHLKFNEVCLNNALLPNYTNIYIYITPELRCITQDSMYNAAVNEYDSVMTKSVIR